MVPYLQNWTILVTGVLEMRNRIPFPQCLLFGIRVGTTDDGLLYTTGLAIYYITSIRRVYLFRQIPFSPPPRTGDQQLPPHEASRSHHISGRIRRGRH